MVVISWTSLDLVVCSEGALELLHYDKIVDDISAYVSLSVLLHFYITLLTRISRALAAASWRRASAQGAALMSTRP